MASNIISRVLPPSFEITRREWLGLAGALVSAGCGRKKGAGFPGYALIATSGEDSVAVVDLTAFRLRDPIPVGAPPSAVVPGQPADHSFVLTPSTGTVHLLDARLNRVRSRKLGDEISEIRIAPDGKRLLAISAKSREVIAADALSLQVLQRHNLDAEPVALDVPPPPNWGEPPKPTYAAVSTGNRGTVELFHLDTGQRWRARMPGRIGAVRFRADGERLLVANLEDAGITALTVPKLEVLADLPLAMLPQNLCFNSDQGQLFVSGEGMDGVAIIFPYSPLIVEQTVLAGRDPGVMACCGPTPAYLFVGSESGSDVCILDIDTRKMTGIVDVGERPTYITVTPDNQYALVLVAGANAMAVIHISAIRSSYHAKSGTSGYLLPRPAAGLFTFLPVGENPVHAAVVPRQA